MRPADPETSTSPGDFSPELVPVFMSGASLPQPEAPVLPDDLLAEALFGEVIDISDLLPQVLSPSAEAALLPPTEAAGLSQGDDVPAAVDHPAALTILYDDDILASGGAIL
jgi:hypothetical protein